MTEKTKKKKSDDSSQPLKTLFSSQESNGSTNYGDKLKFWFLMSRWCVVRIVLL